MSIEELLQELRQQADRNDTAFNALSQAERAAAQAAAGAEEDAMLEGLDEHIAEITGRSQPNTRARAEYER